MIKRMILMLIAVALVLGGVLGFKIFQGIMIKKYIGGAAAPAQVVSTTKAVMEDWQPSLEAVGSVLAINGADLAAEQAGIVQTIEFESGSEAKEGQILVRLRTDDDVAKLRALEATAKLAQVTVERDEKQIKAQAISQAVLDADRANLASTQAQVAQQQATIEKKTIRAPFAGKLGIRQINLGEYLNPGAPVVTLQQLDPIYIDFNLPEKNLAQIQVGQKAVAQVDNGDRFDGEITSINSKVDEATRNISVRATFKNPERKLLPGMFARVLLDIGAAERQVTLPQAAITFNPYGSTVYIIDNGDPQKPVAKQTFVTTGAVRGDQITVLTGVKEGDEVVTAGQLKLRNGSPIKVNNEIQPSNDPNPKPTDH